MYVDRFHQGPSLCAYVAPQSCRVQIGLTRRLGLPRGIGQRRLLDKLGSGCRARLSDHTPGPGRARTFGEFWIPNFFFPTTPATPSQPRISDFSGIFPTM